MTDSPAPLRPGLPLDPVLQLWAGESRRLPDVTWTGGAADPVAPANPMRVCLVTQQSAGAGQYALSPGPGPVALTASPVHGPGPVSMHCRDYPGLTQGEWVGTGMLGTTIAVWEYQLLSQWGR